MHIYCLFCQTQMSDQIADMIRNIFHIECISPKIIQRCWVKGKEEHRVHNYLPGYLFLYAQEAIESFSDILRLSGVIRRLGSLEEGYELTGADQVFARMLYDMDGTLGILKAYQEGDRVKLDSHLYHGFEGEIIRLDRRKGRAQIRFDFDGREQKVWVGYDLMEKTE